MPFVIERLAAFVGATRKEHLSAEVRAKAQRAVLDTLASLVAGVATENARLSSRSALSCFGIGSEPVWFTGERLHPLGALFANCAAASSLDIDDGHCRAAGHPGAAIVPAALAEAGRLGRCGGDALTAIAIGYDVALRIAAARRFTDTMSFASGQWTGFGVAAAVSWLRGLPADRIAHAMAIAAAEAPQNLPQGDCQASSVKGSSPWSTVAAMFATQRAGHGMTGSLDMLDREHVYNVEAIVDELGGRWLITETYLKPYAACRYTHPVIDAVLQLVASQNDEEPIEGISIDIFPEARKLPNETAPMSLEGAQFSVPFVAALAALRGAEAFRPLRPQSLVDQAVIALADKVEIRYPEDLAGYFPGSTPARVRMVWGRRALTANVPLPLGDASNPMSLSAVEQKLHDLARGILSPDQCRTLIASIAALGRGELMPLLACLQSAGLASSRQ